MLRTLSAKKLLQPKEYEKQQQQLKELLQQLQNQSCRLDCDAYAFLLRKCKEVKALNEGRLVHAHITKYGYDRGTYLGNLLVQMYGQCASLEEARLVFDNLPERNSYSWNIMISAYAQNGHLENARNIFLRAPYQDKVSQNTMIAAYARCGHLLDARNLFDVMEAKDIVSWNGMIAAYAHNCHGNDAFQLFRAMNLEGVFPNEITFVSILGASTSIEFVQLSDAQVLHSMIEEMGFEADVAVGTALVNLYAKCGSLSDARSVFDEMPHPNVVSWTTMLTAYSQAGGLSEAKLIFDSMPERNVVSWNSVIKAYAQGGDLEEAARLFHNMPTQDLVSWNTMIATYSRNGYLQEARSVFDKMAVRNVISWNSIIAAYAQNSPAKEAIYLFRWMQLEGEIPNKITFISVLDACAAIGCLLQSKLVHNVLLLSGLQSDLVIGNALINMYAKCGGLDDARNTFDEMYQWNVVSWTAMLAAYTRVGYLSDARFLFNNMPERDLVSWTAVLSAYVQYGNVEESKSIFDRMPQHDAVTWNTMMVGYAEVGSLDEAQFFFDRTPQRTVVSWNAIIAAYAHTEEHGRFAVELFKMMDIEGVQPTLVTYLSLLEACTSIASISQGKMIHACIVEAQLDSDVELGTTIVNMYAKCGNLTMARCVFDNMPQQNAISWNSIIMAYAHNGHSNEAIDIFYKMKHEGVVPNEVTFTGIFFACSHAGLLQVGWDKFMLMRGEYEMEPIFDHYVTMIDLLARAGRLIDAKDLINTMPFQPDVIAWKSLMGASRIQHDVDKASDAAQNATQFGLEDSAPYIMLSNTFC